MNIPASLLEERIIIQRAAKMHWMHWLVVILSFVLTLFAWYISKASIEEKNALQFDRQSNQIVELIYERMAKYEEALWASVAAINLVPNKEISYNDWKSYARNLQIDQKYPGINGIGIIHYVTAKDKGAYLAKMRKERPDFDIYPAHQHNELFPISYIEPVETNSQAQGLDIAHENNRYMAAMKARNTGQSQITAPIVLVQDKSRTPGFLFYAPFYSKNGELTSEERKTYFLGMAYAPFVVKKLMEGTLQKEKRNVSVRIMDGNDVLYDEHIPGSKDYDPSPLFQKSLEMDLYGRTWRFDIRSAQSFRDSVENSQPLIILVCGTLIDTLLIALFILLAQSNQRSSRLIEQLIKNEEEYNV